MDDENTIPYHYTGRGYQIPFLAEVEKAIDGESKRRFFYLVWHRRSGKDKSCIAHPAPMQLMKDPCLVKYVYPTLTNGREYLWDGIGNDGFRYIDHIPKFLRVGNPNETTMKINVRNLTSDTPSIFQIGGSDHPDSLRGGNPKMYIFSEWAEQDPYAWDVVEPILRENNGIAIFNTTPKGDNHARAMYEYALGNPMWFVQTLTAEQSGVWTPDQLKEIQMDILKRWSAMGRSEEEALAYYDQEYMCSFNSPVVGSYYGSNIRKAEAEGRIASVPYEEGFMVHTAWDLGMDDSMTIWFFQVIGHEFRFIDYYESSGEGLPHYAKVMQEKKYIYGKHYAPHDIAVREIGTGKSRLESGRSLGIKFEVGQQLAIDDGINAARQIFSQCSFDKDKTMRGINALKNYKKDWDEKNKVFRNNPKHDWASHGADSFRTFATGYKHPTVSQPTTQGYGGVKPIYPELGIA
jgi:phage terminase large subunit